MNFRVVSRKLAARHNYFFIYWNIAQQELYSTPSISQQTDSITQRELTVEWRTRSTALSNVYHFRLHPLWVCHSSDRDIDSLPKDSTDADSRIFAIYPQRIHIMNSESSGPSRMIYSETCVEKLPQMTPKSGLSRDGLTLTGGRFD